jgi:cupredoxin-like protein
MYADEFHSSIERQRRFAMRKGIPFLTAIISLCMIATAVAQQSANLTVNVRNHRFEPKDIAAPANVPIVLRINNFDSTPMEFESVTLRVEKVVAGSGEGVIRIRPLSPGKYNFFDDFHQETTGALVVR